MNILLIEPDYKNKYPPLGLMKISSYHKQKGDNVIFCKGCSPKLRNCRWDRIYISTLFTFHWKITVETIRYYGTCVQDPGDIYVGGIMATLLGDELRRETSVNVIEGLLNKKGKLGYADDDQIDAMVPDYSIIDKSANQSLLYEYPTSDSYFVHATRGCIHRCTFCAVPTLEPTFFNGLSITEQIERVKNRFGEKRNLLIMDNNILASSRFPEIIAEIKDAGFIKSAKVMRRRNGKPFYLKRIVDFNQGVDARLLNKKKMRLISEIPIEPLRIAFDNIKYENLYTKNIWLAADCGIKLLSNYILFNYKDGPDDFFRRLQINIEMNEELDKRGYQTRIWSFPMKYSPVLGKWCKTRKFVGINWNKRYLRGIQCILLATHGVVGPKRLFFERAFGRTAAEFKRLITLPDEYIIYREKNKELRRRLENKIDALPSEEKKRVLDIILENDFEATKSTIHDRRFRAILRAYEKRNSQS